jgi:ribosomal protein RSM22 (predicted rRNA methylase)
VILPPQSLLDVGAGPGTATWAAAEAFSSLRSFGLLDANAALRALALDLSRENIRLRGRSYQRGEARAALADAEPADLVVASYMIGEIDSAEQKTLAGLIWAKTRDALLIVEPGTPAGTARILALREQLIASGAHVAAPCPHDQPCPLIAPDWCHFVQRLTRSRAHKQVKDVDVPFEDEKFIYLALTRAPVARPTARVLAQPAITKVAATAKLCCADGTLQIASISRRDKPAFAAARRWNWGDGVVTKT